MDFPSMMVTGLPGLASWIGSRVTVLPSLENVNVPDRAPAPRLKAWKLSSRIVRGSNGRIEGDADRGGCGGRDRGAGGRRGEHAAVVGEGDDRGGDQEEEWNGMDGRAPMFRQRVSHIHENPCWPPSYSDRSGRRASCSSRLAVAISNSGWLAAQGPYSARSMLRACFKLSTFGSIRRSPTLISGIELGAGTALESVSCRTDIRS